MTRRSAAVSVPTIFMCLAAAAPIASAKVLINEINTGGADYVELRNPSAIPVDVSGWTVYSWIASGPGSLTAEAPFTFPPDTLIKGDSFLVVQEFGAAGQPGSLPLSISTGKNYLWTPSRTIEIALIDDAGRGVDYVYLNRHQNAPAPNLPSDLWWTGEVTPGTGNRVIRIEDYDSNSGFDWLHSDGAGSPGALNEGQINCSFFKEYGDGCVGTGGFVPTLQSMSCPTPGGAVYFRVGDAMAGTQALLFFGRTGGNAPLPNGCLIRIADLYGLMLPIPLGGAGPGRGVSILAGHLPAGVEKVGFTVQALILDPGAVGGVAATNAARVFIK